MNYIILDLEWDCAYSKQYHRFINHIIQIGAVKLNYKLKIIDTFSVTVKSTISKKLSKRFIELTGISNKDMLSGLALNDAVANFNRFAGKDSVILTWSTSDLYTIIENSKLFLNNNMFFEIEKYIDLQSYVQNKMRADGFKITSQISLSNAANMLNISTDGLELHTAKDDCLLSVNLFKYAYDANTINKFIIDTADKTYFDRLTFKSYYITNIKSDFIKSEDLVFKCDKCGSVAKCLTGWKYRNPWFSANFRCTKCMRNFIGRISFKRNYDSVTIKRKIIDLKAVKDLNERSMHTVPKVLPVKKNTKS